MSWVTDPARTPDELFTVELIVESRRRDADWPVREVGFDATMARMCERKHNPRHQPSLRHDELLALQKKADSVTRFSTWGESDRLVRDLKALRFFPALTNVNIAGSDVSDLSPLASLRRVQSLSIGEYGEFTGCHPINLSECGEMPALESLHLSLRNAWPDLRALAKWPALTQLRFNGNILVFEDVEVLPTARLVMLKDWVGAKVPVRTLRNLPLMPAARILGVHGTASLEGAERYPTVVNLELAGTFHDLGPLAALQKVTSLTLEGEHFRDLAPLARMPALRELLLVRERPLDLSPLADAPQLRRVEMPRCAMMRTEVAALNAVLLPEAADFEAEEARVLPPLKFFLLSKENKAGTEYFSQRTDELSRQRQDFHDGDVALAKGEARVMLTKVQNGLDKLLGRGWGLLEGENLHYINLRRFADTVRIREVVQLLRELSARSRIPWKFSLIVEPHGDMTDDLEKMAERERDEKALGGDWLAPCYEVESVLRENAEQLQQRRQRYAEMEREYRAQLLGDTGIDPALLFPPPVEPEPEEEIEEPELPSAENDDDDEEGGVAIAPPPPPPKDAESLSDDLMYYLEIYEDCMVVTSMWAARACYQLGEAPEEWTPQHANG